MKSKKLTYLLSIIVIVIWGLIIYRVVVSTRSNDDSPIVQRTVVKEPYNDYTITRDTSHLMLNYRDPFGISKPKDSIPSPKHSSTNIKIAAPKIAMDWGFLKYSGYIQNPGSKKLVAIISINGKSVMLADGESNSNVKLLKNMKDSVKISFNGKLKFITMHKRN